MVIMMATMTTITMIVIMIGVVVFAIILTITVAAAIATTIKAAPTKHSQTIRIHITTHAHIRKSSHQSAQSPQAPPAPSTNTTTPAPNPVKKSVKFPLKSRYRVEAVGILPQPCLQSIQSHLFAPDLAEYTLCLPNQGIALIDLVQLPELVICHASMVQAVQVGGLPAEQSREIGDRLWVN